MKRLLSILLIAVSALAVQSCGLYTKATDAINLSSIDLRTFPIPIYSSYGNSDYIPIGIVTCESPLYVQVSNSTTAERVYLNDLIMKMCIRAINMGGDAMIELDYTTSYINGSFEIYCSAMVVKWLRDKESGEKDTKKE